MMRRALATAATGGGPAGLRLPAAGGAVVSSSSTCAATNLAIEEWLFRNAPVGPGARPVLFVYRNGPTVVLGRNQNPWKQCRMEGLGEHGVALVRRNSGGGTVYQDLGMRQPGAAVLQPGAPRHAVWRCARARD